MIRQTLLVTATAFLLAACGSDAPQASSQPASPAALPSDPALASLYQQTCMACHTQNSGGAPRTGNAEDWAPRLAKGEDVLLDNAINGFRGMPPLGSCMDCGEEDFAALIHFMATPQ